MTIKPWNGSLVKGLSGWYIKDNQGMMGTTINELNNHVVAESSESGNSLRAPSHCGSDNFEFAFSNASSSG